MFTFIRRILQQLTGETIRLLIFAGVLLLIWGTLAPVGTLIWWFNQGAQTLGLDRNQIENPVKNSINNDSQNKINCYIIFLPGVGDFSANELTPGEEIFLKRLVQLHPNCVAVSDVFPYSVANESLGGERLLAPVWRAMKKAKNRWDSADVLIKIRNLWRFAISADNRYGPIYNQGIATAIIERMKAAHPIPQSGKPVKLILIGTSGGAQVALGAVSYLDKWLNAELIVVSVGGSFDGETGFDEVEHVYHLRGRRDWVEDITGIVFASRWYGTVASPFNQARLQGKYTIVNTGPHTHDGLEGYFGTAFVGGSNTTYVELMLQKVNELPIWAE
ncbi:hypothetical protein [Iningainema tapete]|uniref:Uncharacterized protein n=1 Tax=Iningainema tapete BLCC-T55 TaxID=2748662 RepID=A0A8J6XF07_9CYAN|nr:hypothetical protein [Iningainema tapete]MBD2771565.1 hypothetical protein [Iningainema tapete BLCC-T55]